MKFPTLSIRNLMTFVFWVACLFTAVRQDRYVWETGICPVLILASVIGFCQGSGWKKRLSAVGLSSLPIMTFEQMLMMPAGDPVCFTAVITANLLIASATIGAWFLRGNPGAFARGFAFCGWASLAYHNLYFMGYGRNSAQPVFLSILDCIRPFLASETAYRLNPLLGGPRVAWDTQYYLVGTCILGVATASVGGLLSCWLARRPRDRSTDLVCVQAVPVDTTA